MPQSPKIVVHRRNRIDQLEGLPKGVWVELDVDVYEGAVYLTHDPLTVHPSKMNPPPDLFENFVEKACAQGVIGFVVDCKRENVEKFVLPILQKHSVTDYCFLNEMEVQADIFQSQNLAHRSCMRVWKYGSAEDVYNLVKDVQGAGGVGPQYVWVDCWQRGLLTDINKAYVPMTGDQATRLQDLGVKLCICSPELYVHKYDTPYTDAELKGFYEGVTAFRDRVEKAGIRADMVCTKFPSLWA